MYTASLIDPAGFRRTLKREEKMTNGSKQNEGIRLLVKHYTKIFRIPENLNYYSKRDYEIAEKKFLRYALLNGKPKKAIR